MMDYLYLSIFLIVLSVSIQLWYEFKIRKEPKWLGGDVYVNRKHKEFLFLNLIMTGIYLSLVAIEVCLCYVDYTSHFFTKYAQELFVLDLFLTVGIFCIIFGALILFTKHMLRVLKKAQMVIKINPRKAD